jgi:hypothetical protein
MSLRFRRSFRIAPGLRLNTSLRGLSLSMGGRGYGATVGSRGASYHAGLPGTGLSYVSSSTTSKQFGTSLDGSCNRGTGRRFRNV